MSRAEKAKEISKALKKIATSDTRLNYNEWRVILALERAVARLENHKKLREHLVFKGGFVLLKTTQTSRFTRDVDALAVAITRESVPSLVKAALEKDLEDGLWYGKVEVKELDEQGLYGAYRFIVPFQIGDSSPNHKLKKLSRIHIDVGFSDQLPVKPEKQEMASILTEIKPVTWSVYPIEYILAEKLETFTIRASANSRAKDIFDLNLLFELCKNQKDLKKAILTTFKNRETKLPQSFFEMAEEINLIILKPAWATVQLMEGDISFEEAWNPLLKNLEKLDLLLST